MEYAADGLTRRFLHGCSLGWVRPVNQPAGRRVNSPSKKYNDPLVDSVTKDGGEGGDSEEDVVDRITRRTSKSPPGLWSRSTLRVFRDAASPGMVTGEVKLAILIVLAP
jgi:hypothetical protein